MARMFPAKLPGDYRKNQRNKAEIKVYDKIERQLDDQWTVFYSVAWLGHADGETPVDGEADFIIAHPRKGVLIVEVKGGRIIYNGKKRLWFSIDRHRKYHLIDPFRQVVKNKYALINKMRSLPEWHNKKVEMNHCIIFSDVLTPQMEITPDSPLDIIVDRSHLRNLPDRLDEVFNYWKGMNNSEADYTGLIDSMTGILARSETLDNPMGLDIDDEEQAIIELTQKQFNLLDFLNHNRKAYIGGCAGSGKTMLAVEKARRLASEGFRTLLTCYNRQLSKYLSDILGEYPNLTVTTFHRLCLETAKHAGLQNRVNDFYDYTQSPGELAEILTTASAGISQTFDAIIIDEGQDFDEKWLDALEEILSHKETGIFYMFFDDNQKIYEVPDVVRKRENSYYHLSENIRNTIDVFQLVSRFHKSRDGTIRAVGPSGRPVEIYPGKTKDELAENLRGILHRLVYDERILKEHISVLSMKSIEREGRSLLRDGDIIGDFILSRNPEKINEIKLGTVHSFKGLENRIIIITDIDKSMVNDDSLKNSLCYTAFSRPRNHLILMGDMDYIQELLK